MRTAEEGQNGHRLLANVIEFHANSNPARVWATAPVDDEDLTKGYRDITYRDFANAINHACWWLEGRTLATAPIVRISRSSYFLLYTEDLNFASRREKDSYHFSQSTVLKYRVAARSRCQGD